MAIPLLGRVALYEYPLLLVGFTLAWLEYLIAVITMILPDAIIQIFTITTRQLYSLFNIIKDEKQYYYKGEELNEREYEVMRKMIYSDNINDMANIFGYQIENHIVKTKDNYLLNIHRIAKSNDTSRITNGKIVYLHHGLLMCSEIWLTMLDKHLNLPLMLYDLGYDVWLGNNRGNKYCQKHINYSVKLDEFWNFSLDEFALFDIPDIIDYILRLTGSKSLTYIGFSQGTAQAFASVSINNDLNDKIDKIIAISPATTPHGLYSKFLDIFGKSSPNIIYLLFSRKIIMPSVIFWQRIMYPPLFNTSIDISNYLLFNWKSLNILKLQKLCSYGHLYSTTSVKTVVHWFQIMKNKNFQMYLDPYNYTGYYQPLSYPLKNIKIPIHLIYGNEDSLVDIDVMKNQLPSKLTTSVAVEGHEHLDNIWGYDIHDVVFKYVLQYLADDGKLMQNGSVPL